MKVSKSENSKWLVLISMIICLSLIFLDQTAVPITLEALRNNFHSEMSQLQWVLNAYILTLTSLIMIGGKLADLVGNRKIYFLGCAIFCLASLFCGYSENINILIMARALQGVGAAFMLPASGVLLTNAFSLEERGKAMGIYIASASLFLALGPIFGGVITQHLSWRWVYYINIPLILLSTVILCAAKTQEIKEKIRLSEIDWLGFSLLIFSIVPAVFTLMQGNEYGWGSAYIIGLVVLSITSFNLFLLTERRKKSPLIDLKLFHDKSFGVCVTLIILTQISIIAISFWPILIVNIFGLSPQQTGLALICATAPIMLIAPLAGKLMDDFGVRVPIIYGFSCILMGTLFLALVVWTQNYLLLLLGFFIYGCGPSFMVGSLMTHIMNTVEPQKRGTVAGVASFFRQFGGTIGLTLISLMMNNVESLKNVSFIKNKGESYGVSHEVYTNLVAFSGLSILVFILFLVSSLLIKSLPQLTRVQNSSKQRRNYAA